MKNNLSKLCSILMLSFIIFSCSYKKKKGGTEKKPSSIALEQTAKIKLTKAPASPTFPDATLLKSGDVVITPTDSTFTLNYNFDVKNYELGMPTEDYETRGIANSKRGQHIHFIVNNGPYVAHYMSGIHKDMESGNYVVLSFLSRSYHESLKNPEAFHVENLVVGDVKPTPTDLTAPHLFYSRPKGTYTGDDTNKVMLDFYLLNTSLAAEGNTVRATIRGKEFTIDQWASYYIEGLPMGETTIKLELMDSEGNIIPGPFNLTERTITLSK